MQGMLRKAGQDKTARLPGEEGIWIFILGDMVIFSLFFVTYIYYRAQQPALFNAAQAHLNLHLGVINTLILLTSSWFVVMGVDAVRGGRMAVARGLLMLGWACGACFVGVKALEYKQKFHEGITLLTNDFFMYYFMYTGIHLVHVMLGLACLAWLIGKCGTASGSDAPTFEIGASFWHMVDLLWIMLFPLLYLVK